MTLRLLALDLGGTKLAVARIDVEGQQAEVATVRRAATPGDAAASREVLWELADEIVRAAEVHATGVSFGGPVDAVHGVVRTSHHVGGWAGFPLRAAAAERYGVPCSVLNDANAGALGEQRWGAARGYSDVLYVTISTGVGAGLVLGGRLYAGAHGLAGELGHLPVAVDGPVCSCGRRGCLEAFASGPSIARAARAAVHDQPDRATLLRGVDADRLDARTVAAAAHRGDEIALAVLARAGAALGLGLASASLLCDPEAIVLGGGVIGSGEPLLGPARAVLRERVLGEPPPVLVSTLALEAPLYGAAAAAVDLLVGQYPSTAGVAPSG